MEVELRLEQRVSVLKAFRQRTNDFSVLVQGFCQNGGAGGQLETAEDSPSTPTELRMVLNPASAGDDLVLVLLQPALAIDL